MFKLKKIDRHIKKCELDKYVFAYILLEYKNLFLNFFKRWQTINNTIINLLESPSRVNIYDLY